MVPVTEVGSLAPLTVRHACRVDRDPVGQIQDMGKTHLGHGIDAIGGDIGDNDAVFSCRIKIDDIKTGGQDTDIAQMRQLGNDGSIQNRFVGQQYPGTGRPFEYGGGRSPVEDLDLSEFFQFLPTEIAGIQGISVENYNLHSDFFRDVNDLLHVQAWSR